MSINGYDQSRANVSIAQSGLLPISDNKPIAWSKKHGRILFTEGGGTPAALRRCCPRPECSISGEISSLLRKTLARHRYWGREGTYVSI